MNDREKKTAEDRAEMGRCADTLYAELHRLCGGYVVDEHNRPVLNELCYWIMDWPTQFTVQGAGLMLRGGVGTGKTDLMRGLSRTLERTGEPGFQIVSAVDIVSQFDRASRDENQNGGSKVIQRWGKLNESLCIDDIGEEPEGKHFGTKRDVIAEIITLRYQLWKSSLGPNTRPILTHFTTNILTNDAFGDKYDERITSRVFEMSRVVPVPGEDRRGTFAPVVNRQRRLFAAEPAMPTAEEQEAARLKIAEIKAAHPHIYKDHLRVEHTLRGALDVPADADVVVRQLDPVAHLNTYTGLLKSMSDEDLVADYAKIEAAASEGHEHFLWAIKNEQQSRVGTTTSVA